MKFRNLMCHTLSIAAVALLAPLAVVAQDDAGELETSVKLVGRYVTDSGVELRLLPDRLQLLTSGLRDGLILERSVGTSGTFTDIATLRPADTETWRLAVVNETDADRADLKALAFAFYEASLEPTGAPFDFEEGILALTEQKDVEDFVFSVFLLAAIRDAEVAQLLGLAYTDADVVPGTAYTYRVRPVVNPEVYIPVPFLLQVVATTGSNNVQNIVDFYEDDTSISFAWVDDDTIMGTHIDRRAADEQNFTRLTEEPIFNLSGNVDGGSNRSSFLDENLVNYKQYTYRFSGYNLFGEFVQFAEVLAMPRDRTPPDAPFLDTPEHTAPNQVSLRWEMTEPVDADLLGFIVARSQSNQGEFTILHQGTLGRDVRTFVDSTFIVGDMNYYIVQALDTFLNVSSSFPIAVTLIDTIPPVKPLFLSGLADSTGVVTLVVKKNDEADLMGYRLFRSNDPTHEFSVIFEAFTELDTVYQAIQTTFTDTVSLNTTTPEVFYMVQALDRNFNESALSDVLVVTRPDTVPPVAPVIFNVDVFDDRVTLYIEPSSSDDVMMHELYRKLSEEDDWVFFSQLDLDQREYTDSLVTQNQTYHYSIRALDKSYLYSEYAFPVTARPYDSGRRPSVVNLSQSVQDGMATISWDYDMARYDAFFVVYRQDSEGNMRQLARMDKTEYEFRAPRNQVQIYAVKAFTKDGGQSPLSSTIRLVFE